MKNAIIWALLFSFSAFGSKIELEIERKWKEPNSPEKKERGIFQVPMGEYWNFPQAKGHPLKYKIKVNFLNKEVNPKLLFLEVLIFEKRKEGDMKVAHAKLNSKMMTKGQVRGEITQGNNWVGEYDMDILPLRFVEKKNND